MPFKRPRSPNSTPDKSSDKSAKVDLCVKCDEAVVEDCISCDWCSEWEHRSCASIHEKDFELCNYENVAFFCCRCLPEVSEALFLYKTYSKLDIEFENRFQSMENKLHKGIGQHLTKCFEATSAVSLEDTCKKLQQSIDDLSSKITALSTSNNNLHMEIETTSDSLNPGQTISATVSPTSSALSIIDELADRDRRKKNIIVYNLPESAPNGKSDGDAFATLCSSVYNCACTITKSVRLGKKIVNKHRPLLLCLDNEQDKLMLLSRSYLLRHNDSYKNVFIVPDRTKFEREKHRKLVSELRSRRSQGETNLVIRNGAVITKPTARSNTTSVPNTGTTIQHS